MTLTHDAIGHPQITWGHVQACSLWDFPGPAPGLTPPLHMGTPLALTLLPGYVKSCSSGPHHTPILPLPPMFKLVHYVAQTSVSKRVIGIRLKCFLVIWDFCPVMDDLTWKP